MFYSKKHNNRINSIRKRGLSLIYKDNKATFKELLGKNNFVSVRHKNLQFLATKLSKVRNYVTPDIIKVVFQFKNLTYKQRSDTNTILSRKIRATYQVLNFVRYLASKIWEQVPENMKK